MAAAHRKQSAFFDYYTANGWKVGRNSMKDWKAAARNWMRRAGEYNSKQPCKQSTQNALALIDEATDDLNNGIFPQL